MHVQDSTEMCEMPCKSRCFAGRPPVSNKPDRFTQRCVEELLAKWTFDVVLGPRKPDHAGAIETARRLRVPPAECLYVGDSGTDMQTARAAHMCAVGVLWGFRGKEELLRDGAQHLIDKPSEVLDLLNRESHCS
jgi:phosphoglycolate phosphatase